MLPMMFVDSLLADTQTQPKLNSTNKSSWSFERAPTSEVDSHQAVSADALSKREDSSQVDKDKATSKGSSGIHNTREVLDVDDELSENRALETPSKNGFAERSKQSRNAIDLITAQEPVKKTSINRMLELKDALKVQLAAIQTLTETEDAFNEQFGELYMAYGQSLFKTGETEEARKMFKNALHNVRVNKGVNSIEQRPILRTLFDMNLAIGNLEGAENALLRLLRIDKQYNDDFYTFDLILQMANFYLANYLDSIRITEESLAGLNKAIRYFGYTIRRYKDSEGKTIALPFGDFAYAQYLKTLAQREVDSALYANATRNGYISLDESDTRNSIEKSFKQSDRYLKLAYASARDAGNLNATLDALLQLGDLHILHSSSKTAEFYYQLARDTAEALDNTHPIVVSFRNPVELPAFTLSSGMSSSHIEISRSAKSHQTVPVLIDVGRDGLVRSMSFQGNIDTPMGLRIRAKDMSKRLRFRPAIQKDKLQTSKDLYFELKVPSTSSSTLLTSEHRISNNSDID